MQYLQKEMTKRRDKRLELASRKRSYEVTNATKCRKADVDGVWSWWKVKIYIFINLQCILISYTAYGPWERERKALERPQPLPLTDLHLLPQPFLRKLLKTSQLEYTSLRNIVDIVTPAYINQKTLSILKSVRFF